MIVSVIDREGQSHELTAKPGQVLMRVLRDADMGIKAECDGCCACATCHIYVDNEWYGKLDTPEDEEQDMLDEAFDVQENSRLSCQITLNDALDGIKVVIAPDWD